MFSVDENEYEAVIERSLRAEFGLVDDEPLPPPGPIAIATAYVRERERPFVEEVTRRLPAYEEAWTAAMRLAQGGNEESPTIVWRDPATR